MVLVRINLWCNSIKTNLSLLRSFCDFHIFICYNLSLSLYVKCICAIFFSFCLIPSVFVVVYLAKEFPCQLQIGRYHIVQSHIFRLFSLSALICSRVSTSLRTSCARRHILGCP